MDYSLLIIFFKKSQWADDEPMAPSRKDSREMAFSRMGDIEENVVISNSID